MKHVQVKVRVCNLTCDKVKVSWEFLCCFTFWVLGCVSLWHLVKLLVDYMVLLLIFVLFFIVTLYKFIWTQYYDAKSKHHLINVIRTSIHKCTWTHTCDKEIYEYFYDIKFILILTCTAMKIIHSFIDCIIWPIYMCPRKIITWKKSFICTQCYDAK